MTEAWIIDAVRSPRGKGKDTGALHNVHPQRILAQVLNALQQRNGFDTADVDDVIMGCGAGSGDHSMDIARMAALDAGWSVQAPGVTLNRFCGSGQQAVNFGAAGILAGFQDMVVAGGVESMSRPAPMHQAAITRYGTDATLLCYGPMAKTCLDAAAVAADEGTSLEVVDLRTISPIDWVTIQSSVRRTKRAIVVHEAPKTLGIGSEIAAKLHEDLFYVMESPVMRVAGYDMPYPPARVEGEYLPSVDRILDTVDQSLAY